MAEKPADPQPTPEASPPAPKQVRPNELRPTPLGHAHAEYRPQERRWVLGHRDPNEPRRTPLGAVHFSIRPEAPREIDDEGTDGVASARPRRAVWFAVGALAVGASAFAAWLLL